MIPCHREELPYFGPLTRLSKEFIDVNLAFSRVTGRPKRYVQDLIRERGDTVVAMLQDPDAYIYICGLKGREQGVEKAFRDVCRQRHLDWDGLRPLLAQNRIHVETIEPSGCSVPHAIVLIVGANREITTSSRGQCR